VLIDSARHRGQRGPGDFVFVTVVLGGAWLLGRALRGRGLQAAELQQRAAQLGADQQAQARAAVTAELARIARELHDVIAHSVSVLVVQAGAAEQLLEETPERARGPLEAVQDTGRQTPHVRRNRASSQGKGCAAAGRLNDADGISGSPAADTTAPLVPWCSCPVRRWCAEASPAGPCRAVEDADLTTAGGRLLSVRAVAAVEVTPVERTS
jgi:hypothetical protein